MGTRPPVINYSLLGTISTLEGQAQFIGHWNADMYRYKYEGNREKDLVYRLEKMAQILRNTGFSSDAINEILE